VIDFFDLDMDIDPVTGKCTSREQMYTHVDTEGVARYFAVSRMAKHLEENPGDCEEVITLMEPDFAHRRLLHGGVEQHRLKRIKMSDIDDWPPIAVAMDDGSNLMVDGSHRYVAACFIYHMRWIKMRLMPLGTWERFLIKMPRQLDESKIKLQLLRQHIHPLDSRIK
jgi:hypothetical protein